MPCASLSSFELLDTVLQAGLSRAGLGSSSSVGTAVPTTQCMLPAPEPPGQAEQGETVNTSAIPAQNQLNTSSIPAQYQGKAQPASSRCGPNKAKPSSSASLRPPDALLVLCQAPLFSTIQSFRVQNHCRFHTETAWLAGARQLTARPGWPADTPAELSPGSRRPGRLGGRQAGCRLLPCSRAGACHMCRARRRWKWNEGASGPAYRPAR